ncbi:MAG TPA: serine/threonine-protein kinase [Polyangiaceae bacterium]|jgi:serine/threonine-protein kinase
MGTNVAVGDLVDGKYRIIRVVGEGGWGIVFEGENIRTYKHVAVKILRVPSGVTTDILARFEREAQAAGRIGSDHIVEVYDLGSLDDGTHYMVMELLVGEELSGRLRGGPLDPVVAAKLVIQLLDGLKAAHAAGIFHRDLKPANLFLVPTRSGEEFLKILDFGISKFNNGPAGSATMTGAVLGSPYYMAPEQARGLKEIDGRTDLYAVGTLLFECLTGRVPFEGDNFNDLMFKIVLAPRPDPCSLRADLDPELGAMVVKAMSPEPTDRFQSADEFADALAGWLEARGVVSVRGPELKRLTATTPRVSTSRAVTPMRAGTPNGPARTGDPAQAPGETPLVSSQSPATVSRRAGPSPALIGVAAVVVVAAVVGGVLFVNRGAHPASASTIATAPAPLPPPPAETLPPVVEVAPPPAVSLTPPADSSVPSAEATALASAAGHVLPAPAGAAPGKAVALPAPWKPAPAPAAPVAAKVPGTAPAATPTPQTVSTVEGREIRTGL